MATIHINEICSTDPTFQPPVLVALSDILAQRINSRLGRKVRKLQQAVQVEIEVVKAEFERLRSVYARRDENGNPVNVESERDLDDVRAFRLAVDELMNDTLDIEGIPFAAIEDLSLKGATWASSIIEDE